MKPFVNILRERLIHPLSAIFIFFLITGLLYPVESMNAYASHSSTEQRLPGKSAQDGTAKLSDAVTLDGSGGTYSISGTVTYNSDGLAGVAITATSDTATFTATTADDGTYTITGVTTDTYAVAPILAGYTFTPSSTDVQVDIESIIDVDFVARMTQKRISGTIFYNGAGLGGVTVSAKKTGGSTRTTTTAANGTYTFSNVSSGYYTIKAVKTNYVFSPASRIVPIWFASATNKNFTAFGTKSISGKVSVNNVGLAGVKVYVGLRFVTTDAGGNYTIPNLGPGIYTLIPRKVGYTFFPPIKGVRLTSASVSGQNFSGRSVVCRRLTKVVSPVYPLAGGTITADPVNSPECAANSYLAGTVITLTATPATNYTFVRWSPNVNSTTNTLRMPVLPSVVIAYFRYTP